MKSVHKLTYSLGLFVLLSLLLHLITWTGLSGAGIALLAGLGRAATGEVINVLIADPPPEPQAAPASAAVGTGASVGTAPAGTPAGSAPGGISALPADSATTPEAGEVPAAKKTMAAAEPVFSSVSAAHAVRSGSPPQGAAVSAQVESPSAAVTHASLDVPVSHAPAVPAPPDILPFAREMLTFSLYWSGINVGTATMEAVKEGGSSTIRVRVRSNAMISAFYPVEEQVESRLVNGRPASYTIRKSEGKRRGDNETVFDVPRDKVVYINHLNNERKEHDMGGKLLWDVMSAFYYLRRQSLHEGHSVKISMFDSNKFLNTEVRVVKRENAEQADGREVPAVVVEPLLNSEGLFQKSGEILIWLTDDERRLPLKMETKLKIGRVTAELKSFSVSN